MARVAIVEDRGPVGDVTERMACSLGHDVRRYRLPSEFEREEGWKAADMVLMDNRFGSYVNPAELGSEYLRDMFWDRSKREEMMGPPAYCLMSGDFHANPMDVHEMNSLGFHYMEKPFSTETLSKTLKSMLEGRKPSWKPMPTDSE